jgi:hypothetical protein
MDIEKPPATATPIFNDWPPNFESVLAVFPEADRTGVLFAYDGAIYNPSEIPVPRALLAHENVHLKRQALCGAARWWDQYLCDCEFRYNEELLAHVAEFQSLRGGGDRNFGARLLLHTALRLVAPLYNYEPPRTVQQAVKDLRQEITK